MIKSRHSVHINRPVHEVFEYLCDHENRIYWQGNLTEHEHERTQKGSKITEVRNVLGRRVEIQGEITEFTTGNLVYEWEGHKFTPPVYCGLLQGTLRNELLISGEVQERVLAKDEIARCSALWFINSVRGWIRVALI